MCYAHIVLVNSGGGGGLAMKTDTASGDSNKFARSRRMLQTSVSVSSRLQLLLDIAIVEAILYLAVFFKEIGDLYIYHFPAVIAPVLMWLVYSNSGVYRRFPGHVSRSVAVLWAWTKVVGMMIALAFFTKVSEDYSRQVIISWFAISAVAQVLVHIGMEYFIRSYKANHIEIIPSLLVGNSEMGKYLADHINQNPWMPHKILGVLCDEGNEREQGGGLPRVGGLDEVRSRVEQDEVKGVYFALPRKTTQQVGEVQRRLREL